MPTVTIRQIQGEELLQAMFPLTGYAYAETPPLRSSEELAKFLPYQEDKYIIAVFEDDTPVATAQSFHMTQTLRGKVYKMGGIAAVATMPQARRRGYARQMVLNMFENMRDEGESIASLYPFRESFYGRLGYISFQEIRMMFINPLHLSHLRHLSLPGEVEVLHIREAYETYRTFIETIQPSIHGMSVFNRTNDAGLRDNGQLWVAVAQHEGEVVGIMLYKLMGFFKDMNIVRFFYKNSTGKYLLLEWLGRHADQVKEAKIKLSPGEWLETWVYDLQTTVQSRIVTDNIPNPMGRVVVVDQLGGMNTGDGHFTAKIIDEQCAWNNGIYAFEGIDGKLTVTPAKTAECELTIQGLSALVFCGYEPGDFVYRGWGNPSLQVQAQMRSLFPLALPYIVQDF